MDETAEQVKDELEFYSKFTKPLIFNLSDSKDRALASSWVKKIQDEASGTVKLRTDYLKLLLFALQRGHLVGVFSDDPVNYEKLEEFPDECDLNDIAKKIIEKDHVQRQDRIRQQLRGELGDFPPYITDCSSDFREYVAAQDIPGFGVHCYYAFSKEPVKLWQRADKGIFPKLAKSAVDTTSPLPPGYEVGGKASNASCVCPPEEGEDEADCKKRREEAKKSAEAGEPKKKKCCRKWGITPPSAPLGAAPSKDDRTPPTWGTNLLEVREVPKAGDDEDDEDEDDQDEDDPFGLDLSGVETFVEEYKKDALTFKSPAAGTASGQALKKGGAAGGDGGGSEDDEGEDEDEAVPQRIQESQEDAYLVEYFREQLLQTKAQIKLTKETEEVKSTSPALVGIPMTTPRVSASPKRSTSKPPAKSPGSLTADDLNDEDLAELGITRDEAKELFSTDLFKTAIDEEISEDEDEDEIIDVDEVLSPERDKIDDEFDAWYKRLEELEKECEKDIQDLQAYGIDTDAIGPLSGGESLAPCGSPVCPGSQPPSPPRRPPSPERSPQKSPEKKKTPEKGKGKPETGKPAASKLPSSGKPSKTKIVEPKDSKKPSASKLQKPSASKLQKPSESKLQKPSDSKIQRPSQSKLQRPSKLQAPKAGRPAQAKAAPVEKGSPEAAAVVSVYEQISQFEAPEEDYGLPLPDVGGDEGLLDNQGLPEEMAELDFIPPSPTEQRFDDLEKYSQLEDPISDMCMPCSLYETPPSSPGAPKAKSPDPFGLPEVVTAAQLRSPPARSPPPRQPTPPAPQRVPCPQRSPSPQRSPAAQRAPSPQRTPSPQRLPTPQRVPSPPRPPTPQRPPPSQRTPTSPAPQLGTTGGSPEVWYTAEGFSPDIAGSLFQTACQPCSLDTSPALADSPQEEDIFDIGGTESLDISPPFVDDFSPDVSPFHLTPPGDDRAAVGYSVAVTSPQPKSSHLDNYKSPPKRVLKPDRKQIEEMEGKYLKFLFGDDPETHELMKRAVSLVADIPQEEPDPYHLMPPSPPSPPAPFDAGYGEGLLEETPPQLDEISPPPSPICPAAQASFAKRPPPGAIATSTPTMGRSQLPQFGTRRSGIPQPGMQKSGIPTSGRQPGIPRPCGPGLGVLQPPAATPPQSMQPKRTGVQPGTPVFRPGATPPPPAGARSLQPPKARTTQGPCQPCASTGIKKVQKQPPVSKTGIPSAAAKTRQSQTPGRAGPAPPPTPSYFPPSASEMEPEWPPIRPGFRESVAKHRIDDAFFDPRRPASTAKSVMTGKTCGKRQIIERESDPRVRPPRPPMKLPRDFPKGTFPITEDQAESVLPQRQYGVPGVQVPPRPVVKAPTTWAPIPIPPSATGPQQPGLGPSTTGIPPCQPCSAGRNAPPQRPPSGLKTPSGIPLPPGRRPPTATGAPPPSRLKPPSAPQRPAGGPAPSGLGIQGTGDVTCECTEKEPGARSPVGRHVSKGFKPAHGKKVQYPFQVPGTPPQPSPAPWWEDSPTPPPPPPFVPPPRPPAPPGEYSGFLGSPKAGPSCVCGPGQQDYSPPQYDSPGEGLFEEEAPDLEPGVTCGPPMAPPERVPTPCPANSFTSQPPGPEKLPSPKQTKSRLTSDLGRRKLQFDDSGPKDTDEYLAQVSERHGDSLPPLSPSQAPCACARSPLKNLPEWRTPEEIESMVPKPKPKTPSPPKRPLPPLQPHEYFRQPPGKSPTVDRSILTESPPLAESPRTPPGRTPPRSPAPKPPSPKSASPRPASPGSTGSSICSCSGSPLASPGAGVGEIFTQAGMPYSPPKLPPPSPPSPLSTSAEMQKMLTKVKDAPGKKGIVRKEMYWDDPDLNDIRPMRPIREVVTKPGVGPMGLPGVVQFDPALLGTGQHEEDECVCGPYQPPPRKPSQPSPVSEGGSGTEEEDEYDRIFQAPPTEEELMQLQCVCPTSPLPQFQERSIVSPPMPSPPFALPPGTPMLDQAELSFECSGECVSPGRVPQITPKPSPMLTPGQSPSRTPRRSPGLPPVSPQYMLSSQSAVLAASPVSPGQADEYGLPNVAQLSQQMGPDDKRQRRAITWQDQPQGVPSPQRPARIVCPATVNIDSLPSPTENVNVDVPTSPLPPFVERQLSPAQYHLTPPLPQGQGPGLSEECMPCGMGSRSPSPFRTPPQEMDRWNQMIDESAHIQNITGEQFSPQGSGSPGSPQRYVTQRSSQKRFVTQMPPPS